MPPMSNTDVVLTGNMHRMHRFIQDAKLKAYLARKRPESLLADKDETSLHDVFSLLKSIIMQENLYDNRNGSIVLCDTDLENAIGMKALHLSELRDQVLKQLVPVDELKTTERTNGLAGEARSRVNLVPQGGGHDPPQAPAPANAAPSPLLAPATARQPFPRPQLGPNARPLPLGVGITRGVAPNAATFMSLTPKSTFLVKEPMREVLKLVPGVPQDKMVFEYEELTKLLSQYILARKTKFFDDRNIKVAIVEGDPLGKAFGVRAFHRTQVTFLLRQQLVPWVTQSKPATGVTGDNPNPSIPSSMSCSSSGQSSSDSSEARKRTRPAEEPSPTVEAKKSRHQSGASESKEAITSSKSETYSSSGEETIYSAQGYETVRINEVTSTDSSSSSSSASEIESDNEDYTEFEIDSDAYRSDRGNNRRASYSSEGSDIEDFPIIVKSYQIQKKENTDFFADSESEEDALQTEFSSLETWKCIKCHEDNAPCTGYCYSCWQERKGWYPDRPKRRRRKRKQAKGGSKDVQTQGSAQRPAFERSVSDPGHHKVDRRLSQSLQSLPGTSKADMAPSESAESMAEVMSQADSGFSQETLETLSTAASSSSSQSLMSHSSSSDEESVKAVVNDLADRVSMPKSAHLSDKLKPTPSIRPDLLCNICFVNPKDTGFVHRKTIHQYCCYPCAKKWYNSHKSDPRCPCCSQRIEKVARVYVA